MWLTGGFPKFIRLDSIVFEGIEFLIPPEFIECFYGRYVFYGRVIEYLNYVVVYVVDEVCDFNGGETFGGSFSECSQVVEEVAQLNSSKTVHRPGLISDS